MNNIKSLKRAELIDIWCGLWDKSKPPLKIGRKMLLKSIEYKQSAQNTDYYSKKSKVRIDKLVKAYKKDPHLFEKKKSKKLMPGTRIIKYYNGQKYVVTSLQKGFDYNKKTYNSLSAIAKEITGTSWNGNRFFGLTV